jgi:peptidoglycan/xylan/chitin deacetylase (PgdA/CDA1 family)
MPDFQNQMRKEYPATVRVVTEEQLAAQRDSAPPGVIFKREGMTDSANLAAELAALGALGKRINRLIKIPPTLRALPVSAAGVAQWTSALSGTATAVVDQENIDPTTGLGTCKLTLGASDTGTQRIIFDSLPAPFVLGDDDVYLMPIWLPSAPPSGDSIVIRLMVSELNTPVGFNYRLLSWTRQSLRAGWNILSVKNVEVPVAAGEYGNLEGTAPSSYPLLWGQTDATVPSSTIRSIRIIFDLAAGRTINIGAIHTAPPKWCKSVIMFGSDDGYSSINDIAVPILREYGWNAVHNINPAYSSGLTAGKMGIPQLRALQAAGDEIWGHGASHTNFTSVGATELTRLIRETKKFGTANGFVGMAKNMAYPYTEYNDTVIAEMRAQGYKLARAAQGNFLCSWIAGVSPLSLPAISLENSNSWHSDANLRGCILRGQAAFFYMHNCIVGGSGINSYPGPTSFYENHFRRWCNLVASFVASGDAEVMTPTDYFIACGIDPRTDEMLG